MSGFFKRKYSAVLIALVLLLCLAAGIYLMDPYGLRMAPDTSIASVDVSGLTIPEAKAALSEALENTLYQNALTLILPQQTIQLSPEDTQPKVHEWKAVLAAFRNGRSDDQQNISLDPYLELKDEAVSSSLTAYASQYDTVLTQPTWTLEGSAPSLSTQNLDLSAPVQTLSVTMGQPEAHLDIQAAASLVREAMANAPALADSYQITVPVTPTALPDSLNIGELYQAICSEPVNDSLDMETYQMVNGSYGYRFDPEVLEKDLSKAAYGQTVTVPMELITPEILGEGVYFRDLLGSCDTKHTNNENRNTNLRLLCQALNGTVVLPGEVFSYNTVVGERTAERGYKPAPAYSGNRLVDSIGGGVCQGSTTLYNCVLLADLEVVFRACHGATVGYVPKGLDAAVNYLTTDFKFRNNWNFPIKIQAEVADGYVKMQILGTDEKDYYIKMECLSGEDDLAIYSRSYKCKYSKETDELISRDIEAFSTYYKSIG